MVVVVVMVVVMVVVIVAVVRDHTNAVDFPPFKVKGICLTFCLSVCANSTIYVSYSVQLQHYEGCDTILHAGLFWCFHNPRNSDMDNRIVNVRMRIFIYIFLHAST